MQTSVIREIGFDYGHRIVGHEGKCRSVHGHRGKMVLYARASKLDDVGRIVDFSVLKDRAKTWIDEYWDHNMVIWKEDPNLPLMQKLEGIKKPFVCDFNPTAENMAAYFLKEIAPTLFTDYEIEVYKIILWETPNCFVEVSLDN